MNFIGGTLVNMSVMWLIAMVVLLVVEGIVPGLVSIWFAVGALAALIAALVGAPLWLQVLWFVVVSVAALILTRPLARKYINARVKPTNADMLIGKDCVVTEEIDNLRGTGAVSVDGKIWTARMAAEDGRAAAGEGRRSRSREGGKLIVE